MVITWSCGCDAITMPDHQVVINGWPYMESRALTIHLLACMIWPPYQPQLSIIQGSEQLKQSS
jgi:hypothetical protein